jgi:hypothetical protein
VNELKLWYMRDNHTFRQLPFDLEQALVVMQEEFDAGFKYGMLNSKPETATVHARGDFETFAQVVRDRWTFIVSSWEIYKRNELNSRKYTLAEIKSAFWETFHEAGELWFPYFEGQEESNNEATNSQFKDFVEKLDPDQIADDAEEQDE